MELSNMNLMDVNERLAELDEEVRSTEDIELVEKATEEKKALLERKAELEDLEKRAQVAEAIENKEVSATVTEEHSIENQEERTMFGVETKEYRDAFYAMLRQDMTQEQRGIFADNSTYGDGVALPASLDEKIWDQVHTAHPILADVATINSGMVLKVTQSTPVAIAKKKDSAASSEQTVTNIDVILVGADYHTYVGLSYAEAKMSQGAMEDYLAQEIASAIGEALAKDVFAQILSDASANVVTATSDMFKDIKDALGLATGAAMPVIYAPATAYYEIVGAIKSGSPFNIGATLGCQVKLDNAATKVTVVDPKLFVLNVVQETTIESARDTKAAQIIISGYMRAEGCLRKTNAAAFIN